MKVPKFASKKQKVTVQNPIKRYTSIRRKAFWVARSMNPYLTFQVGVQKNLRQRQQICDCRSWVNPGDTLLSHILQIFGEKAS